MVSIWPRHTRRECRTASSSRHMPISSTTASIIWTPRYSPRRTNWPMASSSSAMEPASTTRMPMAMAQAWPTRIFPALASSWDLMHAPICGLHRTATHVSTWLEMPQSGPAARWADKITLEAVWDWHIFSVRMSSSPWRCYYWTSAYLFIHNINKDQKS